MIRTIFAALSLSFAVIVSAAALAQPAATSTAPVTASEWKAMVTTAAPGSVLDLGDRQVQFARAPAADITIKGGRFGSVTLDGWRNVTFEGSTFAIADATSNVYLVTAYRPDGLTFRDCDFRGTDQAGTLLVKSISVRDGRNVTVQGSRFRQLANFIGFQRTAGVTFEGNDLSDIREGIQIAGAQNVSIRFNRIGPFRPAAGDHADGIQFFTTGLTQAARHVVIQGNLIVSSPDGRAQGVLGGDELKLYLTGAGYADITVSGNTLVGTGWHGISFTAPVDGLTIEGNTLLRVDGADAVKSNWIKAVSGRVANNRAAKFDLAAGVDQAGNVVTETASAEDQAAALAAWSASCRAPPGPTRAELLDAIDASLKSAGESLAKLRASK